MAEKLGVYLPVEHIVSVSLLPSIAISHFGLGYVNSSND